jgi:hypothetical protein
MLDYLLMLPRQLDRRLQNTAFVLFVGIAIVRIVSTYGIFNAAIDEGFHTASGMEWLTGIQGKNFRNPPATAGEVSDELRFRRAIGENVTPPLAQMVMAVGPYLLGRRVVGDPQLNLLITGNILFHKDGNYWSNLAAARLGALPFFVLACIVVFLWAGRWFSVNAAVWAVLLFSLLPPILGHAGLATVDMPCAAGVLFALYQFMRWIEEPTLRRSMYLGAALAGAVLCKLSSVPFLAACLGAGFVYALVFQRAVFKEARSFAPRVPVIAAAGLIVLWAGYHFSFNQVFVQPEHFAAAASGINIPLGQFISSLGYIAVHNAATHDSYLLGKYSTTGWWYFFLVVLAVKTPIGFLLLSTAGLFRLLRGFRVESWQRCLTIVFPAAILLVCMASKINMGVRHILAIYPFLAIVSGHAIAVFFERGPRFLAIASMLLVGWTLVDSARAHPDYIAYFNEAAGDHPERILVDSDIDWGQDLNRLSLRLRELHADQVTVVYFGAEPVMMAGLPHPHPLDPKGPPHGYVAISLFELCMGNAKDGRLAYFKTLTPKERIGKSIDLFYFP